jgi:hypothetical protein
LSSNISIYPQFFDPERLGASLKEVSSDLLKAESKDLVGRWFHGPQEIDLFLWTDENRQIVKQQLTFYGQVVEWNVIEGNKTGLISDDQEFRHNRNKSSEVIQFDKLAQAQLLGHAMTLILHTSALNELEQKQIIANFFKGQKAGELDSREFMARYAHLDTIKPNFRFYAVQRFKKFLRWLFKPLA